MSTIATAAKLHGVDQKLAIQAIKTLRVVSGGGLRWAKMDVYDKVRDGYTVSVPVRDASDVAALEANGWTASIDPDAAVTFTAIVPAGKFEDISAIVRALGGKVG